jgi:hypothetical protein
MAANDKITPTSLLIANNLKGTPFSTKNTYKLTSGKKTKYKNPYTDAVDFLSIVYAKELKVADFNAIWNFRNNIDQPVKARYTPNVNANFDLIGQIVAFSENEWDELQITISQAFNNIYPFEIPDIVSTYTPTEILLYENSMGVFNTGAGATAPLLNALGAPIPGSPFTQGVAYADAWNNLKVPADAALGFETYYIAPIYKPSTGTNYYYRYTGVRRWASPYTGYTPPANTPLNSVAPAISGSFIVGAGITTTNGTWISVTPITYTYQWYRGATPIAGATLNTYTLVQADAGNLSNISCQVTATNTEGAATASSNTVAQVLDFNAHAYIIGAGLTIPSIEADASNQLVIDLKGFGLWSTMLAANPIVGTTSASQRTDLVTPGGAFDITFNGTWTHTSTGAAPDGVTAYGDTGITPSINIPDINKYTFFFYSRTNVGDATQIDVGALDYTGSLSRLQLNCNDGVNTRFASSTGALSSAATADSLGLFSVSRTGATTTDFYKNGVLVATVANAALTLSTIPVYISAVNTNGGPSPANFSTRECAFFGVYDGALDATQNANLYTAIQTFQTTLSRQV